MTVDPATRRANFWLMIALVIFAFGFCLSILLWMRYRTQKKGGRVYPPPAVWVLPPVKTISVACHPTFPSVLA